MKHIFTVHSPITYLSSYLVIKQLELPLESVILLSANYKVPKTEFTIYPAFETIEKSWFKKLRNLNFPKAYDTYINLITGKEEFIAYIDLMAYSQRILVSNTRCKGFHFIEEGMQSYVDNDNLTTVTHEIQSSSWRLNPKFLLKEIIRNIVFSARGYSRKLLALPYNYRSYAYFKDIKYFCFSPLAYPGIDPYKKKILDFLLLKNEKDTLSYNFLNNAVIFIDDAYSQAYFNSDAPYKQALDSNKGNIINSVNGNSVFVKLRPENNKEQSPLLSFLQKNKVPYQLIDNNLIIEQVLANTKNITLVGNVSAVLFYGSLLGHRSFSIFRSIKQVGNSVYDKNLSSFWNLVKKW